MRVLFASTRGAGHFGPLVPFAAAFMRAGHEVLVAGPHAIASLAARAALPFHSVGSPPDDEVAAAFAPIWSPDEAPGAPHVVGEIFIGLLARAALPGMLGAVRVWRPDVVVRETMEYASTLAAERWGVPQVRVGVHLEARIDGDLGLNALAAAPLNALRSAAGLTPDPDARALRRSPLFSLAPPSLENAGAPPNGVRRFRANGHATRPVDVSDPLVYVSFGSEAAASPAHFPALYRAAADALAELPVRGLMTVGRDPSDIGPLPPSVRAERWVPQAEVMHQAAVMVGHGGSGSTLAALAAGVPQAFVPLFVDGPRNARRVAELGAGIVVDSPDDLAPAISTLLADPSYRRAAGDLATEIRALPPVDEAVEVLARTIGPDSGS